MINYPVSIVLVCMNNITDVRKTLHSIAGLRDTDMEIVVVDSSNNSEIAEYVKSFHGPRLSYYFMPAQGIYAAMNFGATKCLQNNYIWYLNPGDILSERENILNLVSKALSKKSPWMYGQAVPMSPEGQEFFPSVSDLHSLKSLTTGMLRISHQAMLVRKDIFESLNGFSQAYDICSDLEFQIRLFKSYPAYFEDVLVAVLDTNGVSHRSLLKTYFETFLIRIRCGEMSKMSAFLLTSKNFLLIFLKTIERRFGDAGIYLRASQHN